MCFGNKGNDAYDARKTGDFQTWQTYHDALQKVKEKYARNTNPTAPVTAQYKKNLAAFDALSNPFETRAKQDPSANMEMRELTRQGDVSLGKIGIDNQFAKFDPKYYSKYKADYGAFYKPQVNKQFGDARDKLTANLADRGILESTVGGAQNAELVKQYGDARTNIANEANDAAAKLRGTVENAKTNLYNINQASADPQAVNAQAVGQATALVAPPTYSPLGQVFASFLGALPTFGDARAGGTSRRYTSPYPAASGYGSATNV